MLKQYSNIFRYFLVFCDCLIVMVAFFAAGTIRREFTWIYPYHFYFVKYFSGLLAMSILIWIGTFYTLNMYESFRLKRIREVLWIIIQSALISFILTGTALYVFRLSYVSRGFIGIFFLIATTLFIIEKLSLVLFFRRLRSKGINFRNILVVGTGERARHFVRYLNRHKELGLKIIGLIDEDATHPEPGATVEGHQVLGGLPQVPDVLFNNVIDYAVFIVPPSSFAHIETALKQCELVGVTTSVSMDLFKLHFTSGKESNLFGIPMITFEVTPHSVMALVCKRFGDIVISALALLILSPVFLVITILIKLTSPGPVCFVQERCGLNGRLFKLYKFRTMVIDAEDRLKELMAHNEMQGPAFKMTNDPRITPIGKFLRKFSLDELPQIWNVLIGDMSLVGPRPPLPREVKQYDAWHRRRLSMRPGITCTWQAGGRNRVSAFDDWVRMDLEYVDNWSPTLDLKILFKTIPAVLLGTGAK